MNLLDILTVGKAGPGRNQDSSNPTL
jgi:hypothetical protein